LLLKQKSVEPGFWSGPEPGSQYDAPPGRTEKKPVEQCGSLEKNTVDIGEMIDLANGRIGTIPFTGKFRTDIEKSGRNHGQTGTGVGLVAANMIPAMPSLQIHARGRRLPSPRIGPRCCSGCTCAGPEQNAGFKAEIHLA